MSFDNIAIRVENLSKCYHIYDQPQDRLKQYIVPRLKKIAGRRPQNYFREFWALKDISFEIKKGETVGIIGRNGSGKSTLLQMICGTVSSTVGTVSTRGRVAALLELGAGFNPEFTGRENALLNAEIIGLPRECMESRMEEILAFSELGDFLDQPVKTYSSGMYARLAFSIAIHVDPDILIVDEALAVGDARFVAKCMRRIKDIQAQGSSILFVSHDVSSVRTLCERVIWLDKGYMVEQGDVFPVTGRFNEFMSKDVDSEEYIAFQQQVAPPEDENLSTISQNMPKLTAFAEPASTAATLDRSQIALDPRPVTHWGSHKGMILSAGIRDEYGNHKDVHAWGAKLYIVIDVRVPKNVSREYLSIAFSIKDLKGTDLIVSTTHDFECTHLPDEEYFSVSFSLINPLVTGKYLLVAAIENRQYSDIHYYEYVEGAHYFSSLSNERLFGLFQPSIDQQVIVK